MRKILFLCLIFSVFMFVDVSAATDESAFEFNPSTGTITRYIGTDIDVVIPEFIDGVRVTAIGSYSFFESSITSIYIPDGVTHIYDYVFEMCLVNSIRLPDTLIHIGTGAFLGAYGSTYLYIPANVVYIGERAFESFFSLKDFYFYGDTLFSDDIYGGGIIEPNFYRYVSGDWVEVSSPSSPVPTPTPTPTPSPGQPSEPPLPDGAINVQEFSDYLIPFKEDALDSASTAAPIGVAISSVPLLWGLGKKYFSVFMK